MYHIKSDKRSQASAAEIVRGFEECLKTTPLKAITVSDIHRVTGISRATFYRLFDTPEDVLHYQFSRMAAAAMANQESELAEYPEKLMEASISLGMRNSEFLRAVVANERFDLLYRYTEENFRYLDEKRGLFPRDMSTIQREYLLSHLSMGMVATLTTWVRNGRKENPAEVLEHIKTYTKVLWELVGE